MPPEAVAAALLSAMIHALWNALLKSGRDRLVDVAVMGIGGSLFGIALLAWHGWPAADAWPYLLASMVVHVGYWSALSRSYAAGQMSHVYTIARGLAPILVTLGALLSSHEWPTARAAVGIALVSLGIASVGFSARAPRRATRWAALTGTAIASYSLLDALGIRHAGNALGYIGVSSVVAYVPITLWCARRRSAAALREAVRGRIAPLIGAGALSNAGFGLALWAQTIAPIAYVTALRETSVVFGAATAALWLREPVGARRWVGALIVAVGAALLMRAH